MELMWLASVLMGGAVLMVAWWFFAALLADDPDADAEWRYDRVRIAELKRHDMLYRALAPLFAVLGRVNRIVFRDSLPEVQRELQAAGLPRFWLPEEYLARCELLAILISPVTASQCSSTIDVEKL